MSVGASSSPSSDLHLTENAKSDVFRRSANYQPSIWGNRFLTYTYGNMRYDANIKQVEVLKEDVRMQWTDANKSPKKLILIDSLQRLGVAYHFEKEIEEELQKIYNDHDGCGDDNIYTVALRFRLLRQQGYDAPSDVFSKFKDKNGNFKDNLTRDVPGMLCLYEATHLRVHGEDILDEALAFTTTHLNSVVTNLNSLIATEVMHALKQPLHKGMPRIEARHYISVYQEDETRNESLLKLAKLDFNLLQSLYRKELSQLSKWWKEVDFTSKLPYARDRLVELYFWMMGVYFEPQYSLGRMILTKVAALISIIDDTYDAYGTLEELELFTDAIERWDVTAIDQLPEYMKILFSTLLDVYKEMEEEMTKQGRSYCVYYAKEAMKNVVRAYFVEAKWFNEGYNPTFDEYMQIATISTAYSLLMVISFIGMGDIATKEALDWVMNEPNFVKASLVICRLMDDMGSHKFEQKRGHVCSSVECYMKQHGVPEKKVLSEFNRIIANAWKDINQECIKPTAIPMPLLMRVVNLTRMMDVIYKHGDGYTNAAVLLKEYITSLFIDPITM